MSVGLPVNRLIATSVTLAPAGAQAANLNSLLIVGDSDVIDTGLRIKSYASITEVAADFGTSAPEYAAALLFFSQNPQPTQLFIGRWAQGATNGRLFGAALSAAQQALANFTAVTSGGFKIKVDGAGAYTNVSGINLSSATNLNGVATLINTALAGAGVGATCSWNGQQFVFKSSTTGTSSKVQPLTPPTSGTDLGVILGAVTGTRQVDGIAAESALAAVQALDGLSTYWYALSIASTNLVDADRTAIAAYVEASAAPHIYGITTTNAAALDGASTSDIGYLLKAAGYKRSFVQYSATPYAVVSAFARILTTDFTANSSMITLAYKQEPGVTPESLTSAQAAVLDAKRINYLANYSNNTAIFMNGTMAGDAFIDEVFGTDWLANRIQTDVYNLLYTSASKIPQTDAGNHLIANVIEASCAAGVNNGLLAPGTWTAGGFGQLAQGDFLPKGFYVYQPPISSQAQPDRAARKSVTFQVAAKLAGAVHTANISISVNR